MFFDDSGNLDAFNSNGRDSSAATKACVGEMVSKVSLIQMNSALDTYSALLQSSEAFGLCD